jgi:hypothetical protein
MCSLFVSLLSNLVTQVVQVSSMFDKIVPVELAPAVVVVSVVASNIMKLINDRIKGVK